MTSIEMQYSFDNYCRTHEKLKNVPISTDDMEMYLNAAQDKIIDANLEKFDELEVARHNLSRLISSSVINSFTTTTRSLENSYYVALPSDLRNTLINLEEATFTLNGVSYRSRVKPITGKHYKLNKDNPFKQPYKDMVWRTNFGVNTSGTGAAYFEVSLPDGGILNTYYLTYLRQPTAIDIIQNTTSDLLGHLHDQIVIEAVNLFLKSHENNLVLTK